MSQRLPQPWFRTGKDAWYVRIDGKLHRLAKGKANRDAALKEWHRLMLERQQLPEESKSVQTIADAYLARPEAESCKPNTRRIAQAFVRSFAERYGHLHAKDMRRAHLQAWLDQHPDWSDSTAWTAATFVIAAFNWAAKEDHLPFNPIKGFRKPSVASRGADCLVSPEVQQLLLERCTSRNLRTVSTVLRETGCRPGEVCAVTAADFNADQGLWIIRRHKTRHKGKQRLVLLTPTVITICKELATRYTDGPLFRTRLGTAWTPASLSESLRELRRRLGIQQPITPYSYRHSFATAHLERGAPEAHVAALLGHSNTTMLHRHYGHLDSKLQTLRQTLNGGDR